MNIRDIPRRASGSPDSAGRPSATERLRAPRVVGCVMAVALAIVGSATGCTKAGIGPINDIPSGDPAPGDPANDNLAFVTGPLAHDINETSATITWTLNRGATGQVEYGLSTAYGSWTTKEETTSYSTHTQTIANLVPATTYHYRVISEDDHSTVTSDDHIFTTLPLRLMALIEDGVGVGDIVCPSGVGCGPAAQELQRILQISSGVTVPIVEHKQDGRNSIRITTEQADGLLETIAHDGFRIESATGDEIVLYAPRDPNGTGYGGNRAMEMSVTYLVSRDLRAVWSYPGDGFEVIPHYDTIRFNRATVEENPKFQLRRIYLSTTANTSSFMLHNKSYDRGDRFGHDMNLTYPVSKYGTTHPEFYPVINGVRYIPPDDNDKTYWNPVVDAPGAVDAAIETVGEYINAHDSLYYSLSVNDHGNTFDDKWNTNPTNSRGLIDVSNEYWTWVKAVAEGVHALYPDVVFGALAYNNVYDPPTNGIVLPDYVNVFITADLFQNSSPERLAFLDAQIDSWQVVAPSLGVWDYSMGERNHQVIPRLHNAKTKEYLAYLNSKNINTYFGEYDELWPHWLCGPKLLVDTQSLWDYEQSDVSFGYQQWAEATVGDHAAPHVVAYFDFWESYWNTRLFDSPLMNRYRFHGGYYNGQNRGTVNYLHPGEIALLDEHIAAMLAEVSSPAQATMAETICDGWNYVRSEIYYLVESDQLGSFALLDLKDFESGTESSWGEGVRDTAVGHDSNASIRLDVSAEDVADGRVMKNRIYGQNGVTPGAYVKMTGYVRGVGFVAQDDAICFGVDSWSNGGTLSGNKSHMFCQEDLLTGSWESFSGVVRIPVELSSVDSWMYLQTQVIAKNTGQVWFDDIAISQASDPGVAALACQVVAADCDATHLGYCTSQSACTASGGYWCNDECGSRRCANLE